MSIDEPTTTEERAEAEVHERAVLLGELVDGAVREGADEVEVADEWPRPRTRREVVNPAGRGFEFGENDRGEQHGKEEDQ
jgi:hypothetical protein